MHWRTTGEIPSNFHRSDRIDAARLQQSEEQNEEQIREQIRERIEERIGELPADRRKVRATRRLPIL